MAGSVVRVLLAIVLAVAAASPAEAAPGDLDPTFNGYGRVVTDVGSATDAGRTVVVQPDGKILVAGSVGASGARDFALIRYTATGALDTTFSGDGKQTTDVGGDDQANAMVLQPDGRIVLAGSTLTALGGEFALVRYNPDGSLDTTFSGDGKQTTDFGSTDLAYALARQSDGSIVAAGYTGPDSGTRDFAIARYLPSGSLDTTFSADGKQTVDFGGGDFARAVLQQPDGRLVVAGANGTIYARDFSLARLTPDGTLDTTFSGDGKQTTGIGAIDYLDALVLQPNGRLIAVGYTDTNTQYDFAAVRYDPDGALDPGFSGDGIVTTDFAGAQDYAWSAALQSDGKLVAAGMTGSDFALARYSVNGELDPTFSGDGRQSTDFGGTSDSAYAVALQTDGKIVAAGSTQVDFAAARYLGDDLTPPETTITAEPLTPTNDATPSFSFASSETGSTFQCRIDSGAWFACLSPYTTPTLADGQHTFAVRAIDRAGNVDATPATRSFLVTSVQPAPPLELGLSAAKKQTLGRTVTVTAWSEYAGCTATATGKLRAGARTFTLVRVRRALALGVHAKLKLKLPAKARKAAIRVLRAHRRVRASITVVGVDAMGRSDTAKVTIKLTRR